ncbi:asparagine synthetase B [Planctomycetota bacterium]|nr:asparagine synthetase B [Planctomycetota bacterium]
MCGLAGVLERPGVRADAGLVRQMAAAIRHRGPDGTGEWCQGPVGFGHQRLAILDPTARSDQPMHSADGRWTVVYNGELYNFRELRAELMGIGHRFITTGDTEVLLAAWSTWGPECLPRLNGMFAFALWDNQEQVLWLSRDRYGIKPLYWGVDGGRLLFGSEQKAILAGGFPRRLDPLGLTEYMSFQNLFTDRTLLAGLRLLPPATLARVSASDPAHLACTRWWDWNFTADSDGDPAAAAQAVAASLDRAVERQLVSDVEVGAYLSGGIDSGAIVACAARRLSDLKTFTCGFDLSSASGLEMAFDEREKAEAMSARHRTEHYQMVLKAGDMERCLRGLVHHLEEPRVGQCYPNWFTARLAGKFVKVALAGTGGDELFGGYPWRYHRDGAPGDFIEGYFRRWQRLIPNGLLAQVIEPLGAEARSLDPRAIFAEVFPDHLRRPATVSDRIAASFYFEARTFLHGLLVVEDKLSMAHGLETRVPFLDNDLVDAAQRLPVAWKVRTDDQVPVIDENLPGPKTAIYFQRTRDGKRILREAVQPWMTSAVAAAAKQGFSAPDASWFKGDSIDFVRRRILDPQARIYRHLAQAPLRRLVEEHLAGQANHRLLIWSLLYLEQWFEEFLP